jgi:hypothetical protein
MHANAMPALFACSQRQGMLIMLAGPCLMMMCA